MITHPRTVLGLCDGGAHCGLICDASMPTYLLTHWVRDRTRGARLPLEQVVHLQTARTAARPTASPTAARSRSASAPTSTSIDLDGLRLHAPEMVFDLPGRRAPAGAAGRRLRRNVRCRRQTFADGEPTGERPGRLVRAGRRG